MIILASTSKTRQNLLLNAGVNIDVKSARVDEEAIREAMIFEGAKPRDIADCLAEAKAQKIGRKYPGFVLGADQICAQGDQVFSKALTPVDLREQLTQLSNASHDLFSAAVLYKDGAPIWRHVGQVRLTMRKLGDEFIDEYIDAHWEDIRHCVGGYQIEGFGAQLFQRIQGDYFSVLGLPLLEVLSILRQHGELKE